MKSKLTWLEAILVVGPFLVVAVLWNSMPARIPIHWDLQGNVNGWGSKAFGTLLLPVMSLGLVALLCVVPRLDPKLRVNLGHHERMHTVLQILRVAIVAFCDVIFCIIIAAALGYPVAVARIGLGSTLLLFAILGNYLGNLRPNYFIGIRTPWTLENPDTWRATHRLGGRLMFFGSLLLIVLQFFLSVSVFGYLFVWSVMLLVIWAFLYSWHYSRTHVPNRPD
jgi:uncharacterized membrane protein